MLSNYAASEFVHQYRNNLPTCSLAKIGLEGYKGRSRSQSLPSVQAAEVGQHLGVAPAMCDDLSEEIRHSSAGLTWLGPAWCAFAFNKMIRSMDRLMRSSLPALHGEDVISNTTVTSTKSPRRMTMGLQTLIFPFGSCMATFNLEVTIHSCAMRDAAFLRSSSARRRLRRSSF